MTTLSFVSKTEDPSIDVVFIHGIAGNSVDSWSSKSGYWPEWIVSSNPNIRVSTVQYPYKLSFLGSGRITIREHAVALLELLISNKLGSKPIIFIGHSLGGVVIKEMLRRSSEDSGDYRQIWERTAAVVFLATPTKLSSLYSGKLFFGLLGNILGDEPRILEESNDFYRRQAPKRKIITLSFAAAKDVVATNSDPGVADAVVIPIDTSHSEISKPTSKSSLIVASVQRLITKIEELALSNKLLLGADENG